MRGVRFLIDERGRKTAVVIDLKKNPGLWEDLVDRARAKGRRREPKETLETVKRRLASPRKRRSSA